MCRSPNKGVVVQIYLNVPTVFINSYQLPGKFNIRANFIMSSCLCLVHFWLFVSVRSARRYTLLDATRLDHVHCGWTFSLLKADENKEIILLVQFYYKNSSYFLYAFRIINLLWNIAWSFLNSLIRNDLNLVQIITFTSLLSAGLSTWITW